MTQEFLSLEQFLSSCVSEWNDDQRITSLFASLPHERSVNPEVYDARCAFWEKLLIESVKRGLLSSSQISLNICGIERRFQRNGLVPLPVKSVIDIMYSRGVLLPLASAQVKTNFPGMLSKLYSYILTFGKKQNNISTNPVDDIFIVVPLIEDESEKIFRKIVTSSNSIVDLVMTFDEYSKLYSSTVNSSASQFDIETVLAWLVSKKLAIVGQRNNLKIIKFASNHTQSSFKWIKHSSLNISQTDIDIAQVKFTSNLVSEQIASLQQQINESLEKLKGFLKRRDQPHILKMSELELRKKKTLEKLMTDKEGAKHTLDHIIHQLQSAETNGQVLQAFKSGTAAISSYMSEKGISVESTQDAFDRLQDVLSDHQDVDNILSQNMSPNAVDDDDVLRELSLLESELTIQRNQETSMDRLVESFASSSLQSPSTTSSNQHESKQDNESRKVVIPQL